MTPKSLLRLPAAKSPLAHIEEGTHFHRFIPEVDPSIIDLARNVPNPSVKRLVLCSGKVCLSTRRCTLPQSLVRSTTSLWRPGSRLA